MPAVPKKNATRGLSASDKHKMIEQIDAQVANGVTLKDAVQAAGISDQTYYTWKKGVGQSAITTDDQRPAFDDELAQLLNRTFDLMKTPRRDFVVEYKSNRRHARARETLIWGSLDLKAVARAVDAESDLRSEPPKRDTSDAAERLEADSLRDATGDLVVVEPRAQPALAERSETPVEHPLTTAAKSRRCGSCRDHRYRAGHRSKSKRLPGLTHRKVKLDAIAVDEGDKAMPDLVQGDEIESLDIENRKLKTLLLKKIREENVWLRPKLRRFGLD